MSEARTIFSVSVGYDEVLNALRELGVEPMIVGAEHCWSSLTIAGEQKSLRFTSLEWTGPGDELSKIILGLISFLHNGRRRAELGSEVIDFVARTKFAIGVVAEPTISADESFRKCIRVVTKRVDGRIFDGHRLTDADGVEL